MATGYSNIRVGDAEREATASQLRDHYADGRLTLDELNERLDQTFAAKTRADLNAITRDLPMTARPMAPVATGSSRSDSSGSSGYGRRQFAFFGPALLLFWLFAALGGFFLFGVGDKPIGIVLLLAALAFLRRIIFGRRGRGGGRGGRGGDRGGRRCGRR
jgi:hypothetical protein